MNDIFSNQSDYAKITGKNFNYYANQWNNLLQKHCDDQPEKLEKHSIKHISFNLASLLLGPLWMLYRKMYFVGIIFILSAWLNPVITLLVQLTLVPMNANKIYFSHVNRKIKKLKKEYPNNEQYEHQLMINGGVSKKSLILGIILMMLIAFANASYNKSFSADSPLINNKNSKNTKGNNFISNKMKQTILNIEISDGQSIYTIEKFIVTLAGATGNIEWKKDGNDYYIYIKRPSLTDYLKFTYNPNTGYVIHTKTVVNNQVCGSRWRCLL